MNLRGKISKPRYNLTNLIYMSNADMVDWINFRVDARMERFVTEGIKWIGIKKYLSGHQMSGTITEIQYCGI